MCISCLDETHLAKERALADAEFYKVQKEAEANKVSAIRLCSQRRVPFPISTYTTCIHVFMGGNENFLDMGCTVRVVEKVDGTKVKCVYCII